MTLDQQSSLPKIVESIPSKLRDGNVENTSIPEVEVSSSSKQIEPSELDVGDKIRKRPSIKVRMEDDNKGSPKVVEANLERLEAEIEALLIYTKAVKWPTVKQTLIERRFLVRVFQLVFGLGTMTRGCFDHLVVGAFLDIGYTSIINNYTSVVLESSGIPFYCFTSITSIVRSP